MATFGDHYQYIPRYGNRYGFRPQFASATGPRQHPQSTYGQNIPNFAQAAAQPSAEAPPTMDAPPAPAPQEPSGGAAPQVYDNRPIAQSYGYQPGTGNFAGLGTALGFAAGIPFLGQAAEKTQDLLGLPGNYGDYGTTDAQGNVYNAEGRGYDPITGRATNSYGNTGDAWRGVSGSYQNLRNAGEGVLSSALGSYENSVYNPYYAPDRFVGDPTAYARGARLRGGNSAQFGLTSTNALINQNTGLGDIAPVGSLDAAETVGQERAQVPITGEMLGFDNTRAFSADQASQNTGVWGTGTGDLAATEFGPGVINESGQIEHRGGTVVALTDTSNPGGPNISLLGDSTASKNRAREELERRAGQTPVRGPDQVIQEQRESDGGGGGGGGK